jgi:hypothetical protein
MIKSNSLPGFLLVATISLLLICCSNLHKDQPADKNNLRSKDTIKTKPPGSFSDTLVINYPAAVFYNPDSTQLAKIKSISEPMIFESAEHDCFYQMRNARIVLKKNLPHVQIIETSKARYIQFIKSDKSFTITDLDTKNDMCGIIFFNRIKDPLLIDMMNIDTEWDYYFKK